MAVTLLSDEMLSELTLCSLITSGMVPILDGVGVLLIEDRLGDETCAGTGGLPNGVWRLDGASGTDDRSELT